MTSPRWHEVEELFQRAVECDGEERARLLQEAGSAAPELRAEVESLLAVYEGATGLFESCLERLPVEEGEPAWEGRRLGAHVVLREIGRGGMSRVYLAARADAEFERLAVVKTVEPEIVSPSLVRRFLQERQILANLEHPGIARLLDGSTTEDGVPYLVLELVDGLPIDQYCDRHRLSLRRRVRLFLEICDAVAYAHRNLVVHRDLKPANVLVTREGRVKLLDFGIAKLLDPATGEGGVEPTRTTLRPLTPRYASPEQLRGAPLTTSTDVYSLGVVLYELLAGCSPFAEGEGGAGASPLARPAVTRPSLRLAARERAGGSPSTAAEAAALRGSTPRSLRRQLAGDLDTVVLTALEDDPERRYPSVARLAEDLGRWLEARPLSARRPSLADRAVKLVRRNPLSSAFATAAVALLALLAASQVVQSRRIARERDTAEQALTFLSGVFRGADPTTGGAERVTLRQLLDSGAERAQEELAGAPEAQARMLEVLGEVYGSLGATGPARPLLERALELRLAVHGPRSAEAATSYHLLGELAMGESRLALAEQWLRRSIALHRDLGREASEYADVLADLGESLSGQDRYEEAEPLLRQALALQLRHGREAEAAEACSSLAGLLRRAGRWTEVEPLLRQALELHRKSSGDRSARVGIALNGLGIYLTGRGDYREGVSHYRQALEVWRGLYDGDHMVVAATLHNLGATLLMMREIEAAAPPLAESVAMSRRLHGATGVDAVYALDAWGALLALRGDLEEAERTFDEVVAMRRRVRGATHTEVAVGLTRRGGVRRLRGDFKGAEADLTAALELFADSPQRLHVSIALSTMGRLSLDRGDLPAAEAWFRKAIAERLTFQPADHPRVAEAETDLACALLLAGRRAEGEPLLRRARATLRERLGPESPWVLASERLLAVPAGGDLAAAAAAWRATL